MKDDPNSEAFVNSHSEAGGQLLATSQAAQRLVDAIAALPGDLHFILDSLTQTAVSLRASAVATAPLDSETRKFLIESGTFTEAQLEETESRVARGSLAVHQLRSELFLALQSYSLEEAGAFLGQPADVVRERVDRQELIAYDVAGQLRLPTWQFVLRTPDRLLPGLSDLVPALGTLSRLSAFGFMSTPQEDLVARGARTPVDWLSAGGDVGAVMNILEADT